MTGPETKSLQRMVIAAVAAVGLYFAVTLGIKLANLWMLIFGSVVVAVILRSVADPLVRRTRLPDALAVFIAVLVVVLILSGIGFLFGRQIAEQAEELSGRIPAAWEVVRARIAASPFGDEIVRTVGSMAGQAGQALAVAQRIALGVASGVTTLVLVVVAGIFLAIQPAEAREGVLSLAPKSWRPRLREVMDACGRALKSWLKAQLVSMIVVGVLVGFGLWLIGVPSALALGLLTGLAQFIPVVGPIVSAAPALLMAATGGGQTFVLTLVLYVGVSQLEANLLTPLVQKNLASLPIVLGIFAVVAIGTLFGPLGVLFATPLALVLHTAVTMLYRRDVLHDETATAPGDLPGQGEAPKPRGKAG